MYSLLCHMFQRSQNGFNPDVNSGGGHPGFDWPTQLQHGRKPAPESLLLQIHHLRMWNTQTGFTVGNGEGGHIESISFVDPVIPWETETFDLHPFFTEQLSMLQNTGFSQMLIVPLYFYVKYWHNWLFQCMIVWCRSVFNSLVEKIQYLCALLDNINCFYRGTCLFIPFYAFEAHWCSWWSFGGRWECKLFLSFSWHYSRLCHQPRVAFFVWFLRCRSIIFTFLVWQQERLMPRQHGRFFTAASDTLFNFRSIIPQVCSV